MAVVTPQVAGTVYERLSPVSHTTVPLDSTIMYLYSKVVPAGRSMVANHRLSVDV